MIVLQSSVFGPVEMRRCGERPAACPFRMKPEHAFAAGDRRVRCLAIDEEGAAVDRLLAAVTHADDMVLLRQIADAEGRPVAWLSNNQIVDLVARKVARRDFCLLVSERRAGGTGVGEVERPPDLAMAVTPSMFRARDTVTPLRELVEVAEWMDGVEDAQQVRVLEEAARDGVPFCEICEKARQERAASGSAATMR